MMEIREIGKYEIIRDNREKMRIWTEDGKISISVKDGKMLVYAEYKGFFEVMMEFIKPEITFTFFEKFVKVEIDFPKFDFIIDEYEVLEIFRQFITDNFGSIVKRDVYFDGIDRPEGWISMDKRVYVYKLKTTYGVDIFVYKDKVKNEILHIAIEERD